MNPAHQYASLWTPDLAVGSVTLDARNQQIFSLLASVDRVAAESGAPRLNAWLLALFDQFETLLLEEERELAEIAYPELAFHRQLHERARSLMHGTRQQLKQPDSAVPLATLAHECCAALSVWLLRHVLDADRLFFPYIDPRYRIA